MHLRVRMAVAGGEDRMGFMLCLQPMYKKINENLSSSECIKSSVDFEKG